MTRTTSGFSICVKIIFSILAVMCVAFFLNNRRWFHKKSPQSSLKIDFSTIEKKENIVPFLVIGSGPASLAAAVYGARSRIRTVVLEGNKPGGQLTGTSYVENWPGIRKIRGPELMQELQEQAARFGAIMISDSVSSVDFSKWPYTVITEEGKVLYAFSIFIGTGASARCLGIPGENEYWGKGVATCAICDAPYHKGDTVLVIGGGDSAVEEAMELSAYAQEVRMIVRTDSMRASASMIERLEGCGNIKIIYNTSLTHVNGDGNHVTSVDVINNETGETAVWEDIGGVFLAIGHLPNTKLFKGQLATTAGDYLVIEGRQQMTSQPGVFAAGDVADARYKQAGVAAGDGIKAGLDAIFWLSEMGYNRHVAEAMEPYFFDPHSDQKIEIAQINSLSEYEEYASSAKEELIVLDFYTPFCPSCMHMMPVVQWAGTKLAGKVLFLKVDASIGFDVVKKFQAPQVPHFVIIKNGNVVARSNETMDRAALYSFIKEHITL